MLLSGAIVLTLFSTVMIAAAHAQGDEDLCVQRKNRASAHLFNCLVRSSAMGRHQQSALMHGQDPVKACIRRHVWRYAAAERRSGLPDDECLARDELRTRQAIEASAQSLVDGDSSPAACATVTYSDENATVVCQLTKPGESTTANSVDLDEIIDQLAQFNVTNDTVVWFQLWGAAGGDGSDQSGSGGNTGGGSAGKGGYSQMITSVADFVSSGRNSVIYFYLGNHGTHNTNSGGQGDASSFVTTEDMSQNPGTDPDVAKMLMIAGGGGGGGGASFSIESTQNDGRAPDKAGGRPGDPNGATGFVQLVFDLAPDPN